MTLQFSNTALSSDEPVRTNDTSHLKVPKLRLVPAPTTAPVLTTVPEKKKMAVPTLIPKIVPAPTTSLVPTTMPEQKKMPVTPSFPEAILASTIISALQIKEAPETTTALQTIPEPEPQSTSVAEHQEQKLETSSGLPSCIYRPQPLDPLTFPHQPKPGSSTIPATIDNVDHMLKGYGITPRYNVIKKRLETNVPGLSGCTDNVSNSSMTHIISLASVNGISTNRVPEMVAAIADQNTYNPVADWICSKPWDGKDRLPEFYDTVTEHPTYPAYLKRVLMYRWSLSLVAAALKPSGYKGRGVLTFQGEQGIGKTSWLKSLVDDVALRDDVVKVDIHLDVASKDTVLNAVSHWIGELGELDSSFKKDFSRLKGFLTSDFDKIRRPYARTESEYPRRTVFFASVNQPDFLIDNTGNTRWWTIDVIKVNYKHTINMQQLYAQLVVDFNNGKEWWLNEHEEVLLDHCNKDHRAFSAIREQILALVDMDLVGYVGNPAMTASEVLVMLGSKTPSNAKAKECAGILRELFGEPKKLHGIYKYRIPLKQHVGSYNR